MRQIWSDQSAFTLGDLIRLAAPEVKDPAGHLQNVFNWYFERAMTIIKLAFGAAGASFGTLLAAALNNQGGIEDGIEVWLLLGAGVAGGLIGVVQLRLLAHLHRELVEAVRLLGTLKALVS
jgi:hypothetical protein